MVALEDWLDKLAGNRNKVYMFSLALNLLS